MATQRLVPGMGYVEESTTRQALIPGGSLVDTLVSNTRTVTITLVTAANAAEANLSSLKWAWFDQVTPNLFAAPTDVGTAETTDANGVLTIPLPNTTKTAGQVGWLIVTNSDGTTNQNPAHKCFSGPCAVT